METKFPIQPLEAAGNIVRDKYDGCNGGGGNIVADCSFMSNGADLALLFAAAPELLEACEDALCQIEGFVKQHGVYGFCIDQLNAAIAKARGEG